MRRTRRHRLSPCPGCGKPSTGPYCDTCDPAPGDRGYGSVEWTLTRRARLALAGGRCELRLEGCTGIATTVHLMPDAEHYPDHRRASVDECRAACSSCHGYEDGPRALALVEAR